MIKLVVDELERIDFGIEENEAQIDLGLEEKAIIPDYESYTGPYVVNPEFSDQVLETEDKYMTDDVTVEAIYVSRVTNESGGKTVYIGGMING